jgi:hypothetical protein
MTREYQTSSPGWQGILHEWAPLNGCWSMPHTAAPIRDARHDTAV